MGRAFEFRRARKEKRWASMSKAFTKYGREIAIAVKSGGPDLASNARLRMVVQNAKSENMPKDTIESAIKRASAKGEGDIHEVVYEGYGPFGVAVLVECASDNPTRTVANVRQYFNRAGGAIGTSGSLDFMFERKGVFRLKAEGVDMEELELDLIDFGAEDMFEEDGEIYVYTAFTDFGAMQKALEEKGMEIISAEPQRIPTSPVELTPEQQEKIELLVEKLEDDDDVQRVFTNMK